MTPAEAELFIQRLEAGERFVTRHQEQSWGLDPLPDGRFREWRRDDGIDPPDEGEDLLTREQLKARLERAYAYDVMVARLRPGRR